MLPDDVDIIADVVVGTMKSALDPVLIRLAAVEARPIVEAVSVAGPVGEKGLDGAVGPQGPAGPAGEAGARGEKGDAGEAGIRGERGEKGLDGEPGARGADGPQGLAGRDGLPGVQGPAGEKGLNGLDGKDGAAGRDGTLEHLKALYDGERTVTLCFKDGTPIEGGVIKFPIMIYRGVYAPEKAYELGDSVTFANQQWIAREDTIEKPGTGKAWQLSVRAGREGRPGKDGKDGVNGRDGKDFITPGYRP